MSDKLMTIYDGLDANDHVEYTTFKTSIDIKNPETGEYIFKGLKNKVIIPGSGLIARKLFDINTSEITPSYNEKISGMYTPSIDTPQPKDYNGTINGVTNNAGYNLVTSANKDNHKILLFCVGTDGCGDQNSSVFPVDYTKWTAPENLVPFRFVLSESDLTDALRGKYFGRTERTLESLNRNSTTYCAYYFKLFESIEFNQRYVADDGDVKSTVYETNAGSAESYVAIKLKITKQDVREYFMATTGIGNARINTISLCSAYPVVEDGYVYFKDIRPVTKLNIPNESLIDLSKGIDIIYHIYM